MENINRNIVVILVLLYLLLDSQHAYPQRITDSTHVLPTIEIQGTRLKDYSVGMKIEPMDSLTLLLSTNNKLADLLDKGSLVYTRNYGAGNMATLGIRGTSSTQSGLYWNGFDFNAPGAGMVDLSLVPVAFFDKLDLQFGGSAALFGSGNMGGAIHLGNASLIGNTKTLTAALSAGSFGEYQQQLSWKVKNSDWGSSFSFQHDKCRNDYPYVYANQVYDRKHASIEQLAFMQNIEKQWRSNHLYFGLWLQKSSRDIPASISGGDLNSERQDNSVRFTSRWNKTGHRGMLTAGLAVFHDFLRYREVPGDTFLLLDSKIKNTAFIGDLAYINEIPKTQSILTYGLNTSFNTININTYGGFKEQWQSGLYFRLTQPFFKKACKLNISLRQEVVEGYSIPFVPAMSLEARLTKNWKLRMQLAGNYRIPAMNDRYWKPGGNENLKPESGYNTGGGVQGYIVNKEQHQYKISADVFYSGIKDWILWTPSSFGYFMAMNAQEVKLKGLELSLNILEQFPGFKLHLISSVSWVEAINQRRLNAFDQSEGKQLIYTPRQRVYASFQLIWKKLILAYDQSYTGISYTNRSNTEFVNAYSVANAQLRYEFACSQYCKCSIQYNVNNLWDFDYQVVNYYPMPGRSFHLGVNCELSYKRKSIKI